VSSVLNMDYMFSSASAFTRTLCGAWATSSAQKNGMFSNSPGRIC